MVPIIPKNWNTPKSKRPLVAITAYDACFSAIAAEAGVDMILVGDSAANVVLGMSSTRNISASTLRQMVSAVRRGAPQIHVIADLPFESVQSSTQVVEDSLKFLEAGADSVKIEGYHPPLLEALFKNNIPVMGHLGLLPQTAKSFKMISGQTEEVTELVKTAEIIRHTPLYALVLENIEASIAQQITSLLEIPTIGIGAGPHTSGQILVLHDVLGLHAHKLPPFAKKFAHLREEALKGIQQYKEDVERHIFP